MTGEELYGAWCAALFVDWPRPRGAYGQIMNGPPPPPVAWPFLNEFTQKGWVNLAEALTTRFGVGDA